MRAFTNGCSRSYSRNSPKADDLLTTRCASSGPPTSSYEHRLQLSHQSLDHFAELPSARRSDQRNSLDTTTLYFEGRGGDTLGQRGHTKDYRPHLNQMVVGIIMDQNGRPVCSEMWPGNTTDVITLKGLCRKFRSDQHFVGNGFGYKADGE